MALNTVKDVKSYLTTFQFGVNAIFTLNYCLEIAIWQNKNVTYYTDFSTAFHQIILKQNLNKDITASVSLWRASQSDAAKFQQNWLIFVCANVPRTQFKVVLIFVTYQFCLAFNLHLLYVTATGLEPTTT